MRLKKGKYKYLTFYYKKSPGAPVVIFFHGFMGDHLEWKDLIAGSYTELRDKYSYYIFDLPGHGKSLIGKASLTLKSVIKTLKEFEHHQNIQRPIYVGYSMGGRLALEMANRKTKGLFLESTSLGIADKNERKIRFQSDSKLLSTVIKNIHSSSKQKKILFKNFLESWYDTPIFNGIKMTAGYHDWLQYKLKANPFELQKALNIFSVGKTSNWRKKFFKFAPYFKIYYICGQDDRKYFLEGKRLLLDYQLQQIKNRNNSNHKERFLTVKFIKNCSHNIHFQNPKIFTKHLSSFLQELQK